MKRLYQGVLFFLLSFSILTSATAQTSNFKAGKDYTVLTLGWAQAQSNKTNNQVIEFFSYGCPWCYRTEPAVEQWLKTKPSNVDFQRVPATFRADWTVYARAYYAAKELGVQEQVTPLLFKAIQEQNVTIGNAQDLIPYFQQAGIKPQDLTDAFNSPVIDADIGQGTALMKQYQIVAIPTFVINGKYTTNLVMANGNPEKLLQIVDYLVKKDGKA